jgi:hypothetical protein
MEYSKQVYDKWNLNVDNAEMFKEASVEGSKTYGCDFFIRIGHTN